MKFISKIIPRVFAFLFSCVAILALPAPILAIPLQNNNPPKTVETILSPEKEVQHQLWVAEKYLEKGDFKGVVSICEEVLKIEKSNINAHALLTAAHKGLGNEEEFQKGVRFFNKLAPQSPELPLALAQTYLALNDSDRAENTYKDGLKTAVDKSDLRMGLGTMYANKGLLNEASDQYQQVLKVKGLALKDFLNANYALCRIGLSNNSYDAVILRAKMVADLYPELPQSYQYWATAELTKGDTAQAVKVYEKLYKADPKSPVSYQELALIHSDKLNDPKNALRYAKEAALKFPNDAKSQDVLGWVYYQNGKYPEALAQFQSALKLQKDDSTYLYHQGLTQQAKGDKAGAKESFEKTLSVAAKETGGNEEFTTELKTRIEQCK